MKPNIQFIACKNIGQVDDGIRIEHKRSADGVPFFRASTTIRNIFGADLGEGAPTLEAFGVTEAQARERLDKELKDFNDSLWM